MLHEIVSALKAPIDQSFGMLNQFIDVCPENIWVETSGGWPIWQQVYHTVTAVGFFAAPANAGPPQTLVDEQFCALRAKAPDNIVITREEMKKALAQALQDIEALLANLNDSELTTRNEGLYARAKFELTMAGTLSMLAGHTLYHLGSCDAALRNHGIRGVF